VQVSFSLGPVIRDYPGSPTVPGPPKHQNGGSVLQQRVSLITEPRDGLPNGNPSLGSVMRDTQGEGAQGAPKPEPLREVAVIN